MHDFYSQYDSGKKSGRKTANMGKPWKKNFKKRFLRNQSKLKDLLVLV